MNIIICNAPIRNDNLGCVALSLSSMFILDRILNERNIPHSFYLPQSGFRRKEQHTIKAGNLQIEFSSLMDISVYSLKQRLKNLLFYKECRRAKKVYRNADFIFDIGQGDSFSDIYGKERFDWILAQYRLGMEYRKPYCILPQTIGPFENPVIKRLACKGIGYAQSVMARDKQSYDCLAEMLPDKAVSEIIDVAFFMPYKPKRFDENCIHVGLNVSSLLWHGGYTCNNQFGLSVDYPILVRAIINYFLTQKDVKLHLVPHVVGSERHIENDYAVSYDLSEEYDNPNLLLSPQFLDPISAKSYIAGLDFFIGARMHSTIAAFSSGVPVVPMAYSRKFNGLFIDTLQYPYVSDMKTLSNRGALEMIQQCYVQKSQLRGIVKDRMKTIVAERGRVMEEELCKFLHID